MRPILIAACLLAPAQALAQTPQATPIRVETEGVAVSAVNTAPGPRHFLAAESAAIFASGHVGLWAEGKMSGGFFLASDSQGTGLQASGPAGGIYGWCRTPPCIGIYGTGTTGVRGDGWVGIHGLAASPPPGGRSLAGLFEGDVDITADAHVAGDLSAPVIDELKAQGAALTARLALLESRTSGTAGTVLPGRIRAETYNAGGQGVGYFDTTPGNEQGVTVLRADDVDLKTTGSGEYAVGWFAGGEWLTYTVTATTGGTYAMRARVGTPLPGRTFRIEVDGLDVTGAIAVPQLANWNEIVTLELPPVMLTAGTHTIRVVMGPQDFVDFHWLEMTR